MTSVGSLVDSSLGSKVLGPGGLDCRLVHGDDGAVGVGHQAVAVGTVAVGTVAVGTCVHATEATAGSEVVSTGSGHSRLVHRDHSAVRVGHQVGVQVEGSVVTVASSVTGTVDGSSDSDRGGSIGEASGSVGRTSNSHGTSSQEGAGTKLGGQVVGLQGSHTGLVDGGDGPVGVRLQAEEALGGGEGEGGGENLQKAG